MDGLAFHPYADSSGQSPDTPHPNSTTIGLADYDRLMRTLSTAFDGTPQAGSTAARPLRRVRRRVEDPGREGEGLHRRRAGDDEARRRDHAGRLLRARARSSRSASRTSSASSSSTRRTSRRSRAGSRASTTRTERRSRASTPSATRSRGRAAARSRAARASGSTSRPRRSRSRRRRPSPVARATSASPARSTVPGSCACSARRTAPRAFGSRATGARGCRSSSR